MTPRGKGIYARGPLLYPEGPAEYAALLGCSFIAFLDHATHDRHIRRAQTLGLDVYLWSGPHWWVPTAPTQKNDRQYWGTSFDQMVERVQRLGLEGFIADPEMAARWTRSEARKLGTALRDAAAAFPSVGVTSFPSWPYISDIAEIAAGAGLWATPQLYGIQSPCPDPADCAAREKRWSRAFGGATIPSIAAAPWIRDAAEQVAYQAAFVDRPGAIFWMGAVGREGGKNVILPRPGSPEFEVIRQWQPGGIPVGGENFAAIAYRQMVRSAGGRLLARA